MIKSLRLPAKGSRKGDNGRLLIVGGSRDYHGAPVFSILAARRFVDLLYFLPGEKDPYLINAVKRIPEAIVVDSYESEAMRKLDCVLYGIGLSDADIPLPRPAGNRLVIDGDGLKRVKGRIPPGAILTPHENEFRMLFGIIGTRENVGAMARKHGCVILKKGTPDIISDGRRTVSNSMHNQGMTKGGTGDVLAGLVAALACVNEPFAAAAAGALINGYAGGMLRKRLGLNFCASDLAGELAPAMEKLRR
jgi:hydroxyethylthiazole kinase-like uncharacterized protein yjeF